MGRPRSSPCSCSCSSSSFVVVRFPGGTRKVPPRNPWGGNVMWQVDAESPCSTECHPTAERYRPRRRLALMQNQRGPRDFCGPNLA
jgi:hypothetical protein